MNYWDNRAKVYLTWKEGLSFYCIKRNFFYTPFLKWIVKNKIKEIKPDNILEVGCGPGRLFNLYKNFNVVGIDISERMIERARLVNFKIGSSVELYLMNVCNMFFDKVFDLVISSNVLLHLNHDDIKKAINNICKYSINVLCVEWVDPNGVDTVNCYLHDYISLFNNNGFVLKNERNVLFEKQKLFHFKKNKV